MIMNQKVGFSHYISQLITLPEFAAIFLIKAPIANVQQRGVGGCI